MKNILIIGGSGALGRSIVKNFKISDPKWKVMNIDFKFNPEADFNYNLTNSILDKNELAKIGKIDFLNNKIDCIVNSAGGWAGGSIENDDIIESVNIMMQMNLYSAVLAAYLAKKFLNESSLFVLTGSNTVKKQMNPGMLGYELSKQSLHHLSNLLIETHQLPKNTKIITILPDTIDTDANRQAMPNADHSNWTSPDKIAGTIKQWADNKNYPIDGFFKI
jgi:dihydropteridine reductase